MDQGLQSSHQWPPEKLTKPSWRTGDETIRGLHTPIAGESRATEEGLQRLKWSMNSQNKIAEPPPPPPQSMFNTEEESLITESRLSQTRTTDTKNKESADKRGRGEQNQERKGSKLPYFLTLRKINRRGRSVRSGRCP